VPEVLSPFYGRYLESDARNFRFLGMDIHRSSPERDSVGHVDKNLPLHAQLGFPRKR